MLIKISSYTVAQEISNNVVCSYLVMFLLSIVISVSWVNVLRAYEILTSAVMHQKNTIEKTRNWRQEKTHSWYQLIIALYCSFSNKNYFLLVQKKSLSGCKVPKLNQQMFTSSIGFETDPRHAWFIDQSRGKFRFDGKHTGRKGRPNGLNPQFGAGIDLSLGWWNLQTAPNLQSPVFM